VEFREEDIKRFRGRTVSFYFTALLRFFNRLLVLEFHGHYQETCFHEPADKVFLKIPGQTKFLAIVRCQQGINQPVAVISGIDKDVTRREITEGIHGEKYSIEDNEKEISTEAFSKGSFEKASIEYENP